MLPATAFKRILSRIFHSTSRNLSSKRDVISFNKEKARSVRFNRRDIRKQAAYSENVLNEEDFSLLEDEGRNFEYQRNLARIYAIYRHCFKGEEFTPSANLCVRYLDKVVRFGNHVKAQRATIVPEVFLNSLSNVNYLLPKKHCLFMVDLDGNHIDPLTEVTHWGVVNLPLVDSEDEHMLDLTKGDEIFPYVPPIPWQGTGDHRLLFVHCIQDEVIDTSKFNSYGVGDRFLFRVRDFIQNQFLTPISMCWFQSSFDLSVSQTCKRILGIPEPIFDRKPETTFAEREAKFLEKLEYSSREAIGIETLRMDD